jgi:hypothetical protein
MDACLENSRLILRQLLNSGSQISLLFVAQELTKDKSWSNEIQERLSNSRTDLEYYEEKLTAGKPKEAAFWLDMAEVSTWNVCDVLSEHNKEWNRIPSSRARRQALAKLHDEDFRRSVEDLNNLGPGMLPLVRFDRIGKRLGV